MIDAERPAKSATPGKSQLVGTWRLVSFEFRSPDGKVHYPVGKNPVGYLIYSGDGYMSATLMTANRTRLDADLLWAASKEEKVTAAGTFIAYCGRYEIKGDRVIHHVEASLFPNWVGEPQERFFKFADDQLSLTAPPAPFRGVPHTAHLVRKRAQAARSKRKG
jgi:hypothetical protein